MVVSELLFIAVCIPSDTMDDWGHGPQTSEVCFSTVSSLVKAGRPLELTSLRDLSGCQCNMVMTTLILYGVAKFTCATAAGLQLLDTKYVPGEQ